LTICRVMNSSFLVLLYQRQGPYQLTWPLLHLKPLRLTKVRTKTMSRNQKRRLARRHRLLPQLMKMLVSTRSGSVSTKSLLRALRRLAKPRYCRGCRILRHASIVSIVVMFFDCIFLVLLP
jgi:hypothetical protein